MQLARFDVMTTTIKLRCVKILYSTEAAQSRAMFTMFTKHGKVIYLIRTQWSAFSTLCNIQKMRDGKVC